MISVEDLHNLMQVNDNDSKKLEALTTLLEEKLSPGVFKCYNIPHILSYFSDDSYKIDVLEFLIKHIDKITESTYEAILCGFINAFSHEMVEKVIFNKFPDAAIFEEWDEQIDKAVISRSFIINDVEFKHVELGHLYDKLAIHGKALSIKIIGNKLKMKYDDKYKTFDFANAIRINITATGDISVM